MVISTYEFDPHRLDDLGHLFPYDIEYDPWIMFHGTSAYNSAKIEREGFDYHVASSVTRAQCTKVVAIFEAMRWLGDDPGGHAILKPFSLDHDLKDDHLPPVFFSETSSRSLLYATHDFAGGEKLRAIRKCFEDLDKYVADSVFRTEHQRKMHANFQSLVALNAHPSMLEQFKPVSVSLNWLNQELDALQEVRQKAFDSRIRHDGGIIYAVKLSYEDLDALSYSSVMGMEASRPLLPSRIEAKMMVPADYQYNPMSGNGHICKLQDENGLISALSRAKRQS